MHVLAAFAPVRRGRRVVVEQRTQRVAVQIERVDEAGEGHIEVAGGERALGGVIDISVISVRNGLYEVLNFHRVFSTLDKKFENTVIFMSSNNLMACSGAIGFKIDCRMWISRFDMQTVTFQIA